MSLFRGLLFHHSNQMRIIFNLLFCISAISLFYSCSKGESVNDPRFGTTSISLATNEPITIVQGESHQVPNGTSFGTLIGTNRFRFYNKSVLLLDTMLTTKPLITNSYVLFKPTANSRLRIFDSSFNDFDKEVLPDTSSVKFSMANFVESFPDKVDVSINSTNYTPNSDKPIQVGEFHNVTSSFSLFKLVSLGRGQDLKVVSAFTLIVKDPSTAVILATIPLTLPKGNTSETVGKLISRVYLLYLDNDGTAKIIMSK